MLLVSDTAFCNHILVFMICLEVKVLGVASNSALWPPVKTKRRSFARSPDRGSLGLPGLVYFMGEVMCRIPMVNKLRCQTC